MRSIDSDFYLSSTESTTFSLPRLCKIVKRLKDRHGNFGAWIEVEPPVPGQLFFQGANDISNFAIFPRFEGSSLFPVNEWPLRVYICRFICSVSKELTSVGPDDVELTAWGEIYPTLEEATDRQIHK